VRSRISFEELGEYLTKLKCEVEEVRGDTLVYEASHDRPDLFSAEGLGRALRSLKGVDNGFKEVMVRDSDVEVIASNKPSYRPYVLGAIVKGLSLDEESIIQIIQLQEKLHLSYCGDRALVAIGLHDYSKITPPIYYKAVSEYRFKPLGYDEEMSIREILSKVDKGVRYRHLVRDDEYPLLVDSKGMVLSMPPIINGDYTRITTNTTQFFIDITGTDLELMSRVLNVVIGALLERGDEATVFKVRVLDGDRIIWSPRYDVKVFKVGLDDVKSLLGIDLSVEEVIKCLNSMGFNVKVLDLRSLEVRVPPYRIDVMHVVDIIEDIAIAYGYDRLTPTLPPPTHNGSIHPIERFSRIVRDLMIGLGFNEVVNFMLVDSEYLSDLSIGNYVLLENPKMKTYSAVRNSLIPSILQAVRINSLTSKNIKLFEVGDVVELSNNGFRSSRKLAVAISTAETTLTDVLVVLKSLMNMLGINYSLSRCSSDLMISGRCGEVVVRGVVIGVVGEVHPRILNYLGITLPVALLEINLSSLLQIISG
jgi:phenylalanyl-tRNA synthetase beta chain